MFDVSRLKRLLARGFLLGQAIERWRTRAIWIVSQADPEYPSRLKNRLKDGIPPVLYGCGDAAILNTGGLAVVGSRHVDEDLIEYTQNIGQFVAESGRTLISGGARGIDQAAMRGAVEVGGKVIAVLADSLERAALSRDNRNFLMDGQVVLISPYDPAAGFNVGNAMQRNKLIYGLADAALVVSSDYEKGGTWAGAVEQLEKLRFVNVYIRSTGRIEKGLEALRRKGALPWPNPVIPEEFAEALDIDAASDRGTTKQNQLLFDVPEETAQAANPLPREAPTLTQAAESPLMPAEELFAKVRQLLENMVTPKTDIEVANELQVSKVLAQKWLQRLVEEGVLEKTSRKPLRYRKATSVMQADLFHETHNRTVRKARK